MPRPSCCHSALIPTSHCVSASPPCCVYSLLPLLGFFPLPSPQVLREIDNATKAFPNAYIRMCAFDANRQVQVASMLVHRPASAKEWRP